MTTLLDVSSAVNPRPQRSRIPWRWFHGTAERLNVYLEMVTPAWPLLNNMLASAGGRRFAPDFHDCLDAVVLHLSYAVIPVSVQRQLLEWTWGVPVRGWTCHVWHCHFPESEPHTAVVTPDDWIHHKFAHALMVLVQSALERKCSLDRSLGMPVIAHPWVCGDPRHMPNHSPYFYWPG